MKPATNSLAGCSYTASGRAQLLDPALVEHGQAVAHGQRLLLVVGDVDEGDADLALDPLELQLHLLAQLQVQGAERLVQQQHLRLVHDRAGQRDPLPLAAGQLDRLAVAEPGSRTISSAASARRRCSGRGTRRTRSP